eukprot:c2205_g1_i1.p1 GENE.c2205_g1_i1~~c2205_g1_i1.p1  ORF type:complete len:442 (+),score=90.58 c2205_g1_i1:24-1349(+)
MWRQCARISTRAFCALSTPASTSHTSPSLSQHHLLIVIPGAGDSSSPSRVGWSAKQISESFGATMNEIITEDEFKGIDVSNIHIETIEWHSHVRENWPSAPLLAQITPPTVRNFRSFFNTNVVDCALFCTPTHHFHMFWSVHTQLREIHRKYTQTLLPHTPLRISIFAHSLAGAIVWDVLSGNVTGGGKFVEEHSSGEKLEFSVENLFLVGSPVPLVIAMRNQAENCSKPANVEKLYNILHLFDPIGYRIEPVLCREVAHFPPEKIPSHSPEPKPHKRNVHRRFRDFQEKANQYLDQFNMGTTQQMFQNSGTMMQQLFQRIEKDQIHNIQRLEDSYNRHARHRVGTFTGRIRTLRKQLQRSIDEYITTPEPIAVEASPTPERRLDFLLTGSGTLDRVVSEYLLGLVSHFVYWQDRDCVRFVVARMLSQPFSRKPPPPPPQS